MAARIDGLALARGMATEIRSEVAALLHDRAVVAGSAAHAAAMTPVPGGVGAMTIACLPVNMVRAAQPAATA